MGLISRLKTWVDNEVLNYSDLNSEFDNIHTVINGNLDGNNVDTTAVATLSATQTFTNKTLTSPTINTPTIVTPTVQSWNGWIDANETWSYSAWDDTNGVSTATITVPSDATTKYQPGMRVKFDQTTDGTKYGIITKVASTALTVFMNTDYDFDNETISNNYFSPMKAPFGFNLDPTKWQVLVEDTSNRSQVTAAQNTWYNAGSISIDIPIGSWNVSYEGIYESSDTNCYVTLSTANNSESDRDWTSLNEGTEYITVHREKFLVLSTKDTYYLNYRTTGAGTPTLILRGDLGTTRIKADCTYL